MEKMREESELKEKMVDDFKVKLERRDVEIQRMSQNLDKNQVDLEKMERSNEELTGENTLKDEEIVEWRRKNDELLKKIDNLDANVKTQSEDMEKLRDECRLRENERIHWEKEMEDMIQKLDESGVEIDKMNVEIERLNQLRSEGEEEKKNDLLTKIDEVRGDLKVREDEMEKMREESEL